MGIEISRLLFSFCECIIADAVEDGIQPSFSYLTGIKYPQRARSRITWIGQWRQSLCDPLFIKCFKYLLVYHYLTTYLYLPDALFLKIGRQRYRLYLPDVCSHILSHHAVSACSATYQPAVFINK